MADFCFASPYLIPSCIQHVKHENIGDYFIERSVKSLLGASQSSWTMSIREELNDLNISIINTHKCFIIIGANHLDRTFSIFNGASLSQIRKISIPIHIYGLGASENIDFLDEIAIRKIGHIISHDGILGCRCFRTYRMIKSGIETYYPHLRSSIEQSILMTGCPVVYPKKLSNYTLPSIFSEEYAILTNTLRGNFLHREKNILREFRQRFPSIKAYCLYHQPFSPSAFDYKRSINNNLSFLLRITKNSDDYVVYGAELVNNRIQALPTLNPEFLISLYLNASVHFGSRLHAHLLCVSESVESYLFPIDRRSVGMDEHLSFERSSSTTTDHIFYGKPSDSMEKLSQSFLQLEKMVAYTKSFI